MIDILRDAANLTTAQRAYAFMQLAGLVTASHHLDKYDVAIAIEEARAVA